MNDTKRILTLPTDERTGVGLVDKWTRRLRTPGGQWTLHPHQALALEYIEEGYGGWLPIAVGGGKTIIGQAAAPAAGLDPEDVLVLCPASLRDEAAHVWEQTRQHFNVPLPRYESYTMLSTRPKILEELAPKLIVCDEGHKLASLTRSSRGTSFLEYVREHRPRLVMMSGTFTARQVEEYRRLCLMTLGHGAPVPDEFSVAAALDRVIGVGGEQGPTKMDFAIAAPFADWAPDDAANMVTRIRTGFQRRMAATPGVVMTTGSSCDAPISIERIDDLDIPEPIADAIARAEEYWELPDGEEIVDQLRVDSKVKQLTQGFYYRFVWPNGEPNRDWLYARRAFHSRARKYTKRASAERSTLARVIAALEAGEIHFPEWSTWSKWADYEPPPTEAVWMDEYLVDDVIERAQPGSIIWYKHRAVAEKLSERVPTAFAGEAVPDAPIVALSLDSHGTGLNLQRDFHTNYVLYPPSNAGLWEQFLGRTHRQGFAFDQVRVFVYTHQTRLKRALRRAFEGARYLHESQGVAHKLLLANGEIE